MPSPLLVGREIFAVHDGGVAGCIDALTGKELWRERLGGNHDASPTEINGKLYFVNREGKTTILAAGREFKVRSKNELDGVFKATAAIADGLLYISDLSGFLHCLDEKTGKPYWVYDMLAAVWGSPTVIDGKGFLGDEDGDVVVLEHGKKMKVISETNMDNSVYTTPVAVDGVLYIANRTTLFAITEKKN